MRWLYERARGAFYGTRQVLQGRRFLRACDAVGPMPRVMSGRLIVENHGYIELGERTRFMCEFAPLELRTSTGGRLTIGSRTGINYGTTIEAVESITIGERVDMGPYCVVSDSDTGTAQRPTEARSRPIVIEDDVWLASRVTVLPGSTIGRGSIITAGSVVSGAIPARVVAGGIPARVLRTVDSDAELLAGPSAPIVESEDVDRTPTGMPSSSRDNSSILLGCGLLVSDFTIEPLASALTDPSRSSRLEATVAPFGTVVPTLLAPESAGLDFAVVWTQPGEVLPAFRRIQEYEVTSETELVADVDKFAGLITKGLADYRTVIVPTWTRAPWHRGRGLTDSRPGGQGWALARVNQRLMTAFADSPNVFVLDAQRWLADGNDGGFSDRRWYLGKIPFEDAVFARAADDIVAAVATARGESRKLIVVDLDNTLWGGVVGDDGWESLRLGGHDGVGEAFVEFQHALGHLRKRGVLLAIVSKNEEAVALEAIDRHQAMVLDTNDFVGWRINWQDKATNIAELVADLGLGLQSVVFIDDNAHERARVRDALPEVLVPDWPDDPAQYARTLRAMSCFDTPHLTAEDLARTELYAVERQREELRGHVASFEEWLRELDVVVHVEPLRRDNLPRATQLLNKTNQLNLTTRRLSEGELWEWAQAPGQSTWCVSVRDRLGDAGLTGVVSIDTSGEPAEVVDFVLSCRVLGRRVEQAMTYVACELASRRGAQTIRATLLPTPKNMPCRRVFDGSGFSTAEENVYTWTLATAYPEPDGITLDISDDATATSPA
jgi:FkbH-like protein